MANPETLKDLYEVSKKVLSTEELDALVEEAKKRYSLADVIRAREKISSATRDELASLISGLPIPKGKDILAKLDPYLPGGEQARKALDGTAEAVTAWVWALATAATGLPQAIAKAWTEAITDAQASIEKSKWNWFGMKEKFANWMKKGFEDKKNDKWTFERVAGYLLSSILSVLGKIGLDMDFSKYLSAEELKLAWLWPKIEPKKQDEQREKSKDRYSRSRFIFEGLFLSDNSLPISDILENIEMKWSLIGELQDVHKSKNFDTFLTKIGRPIDTKNKEWLRKILEILFSPKKGKYILEAYNSSRWGKKDAPHPSDTTFGDYIIGAGSVLTNMRGLAKAAVTQKMPEPNITLDDRWDVLIAEDSEEMLKLFSGDKKLLSFMLGMGGKSQWKTDTIDREAKQNNYFRELYPTPEAQQEAIEILKKILQYSENFLNQAMQNPDIHLGMSGELREISKNRTFRLRGVALMYMSLRAKDIANFANFSTIEQAQVYGMMMTIFQTEESNYQKWKLTSRYITALNNSTGSIPQWVKEFMIDAWEYAGKKAWEGILEWAKYFLGLASENPKLAASFIALNINFIPARNSIVDYIF
jgi:hypothetical protein